MSENESDKSSKKSAPGTRLPDELRAELREVAHQRAMVTGKEPSWGSLLHEAWKTAKSIPISDKSSLTQTDSKQLPASAGNDSSQPFVLQNEYESETGYEDTRWEHRAVQEILQTEYADAFRVNIRAVYLLATGKPVEVGDADPDAGQERVPGEEVEEIRDRLGHHEQTYTTTAKRVERPQDHRKRGGKPKTGTH